MEALEARRREVGPGREGLMALASVRCRRRILLALALSCLGCGLQNWRLWRLRRLCSVHGRRDCEAGGAEGARLGTSQEQAGQVRRWLRSGEARARMAGRAGSAYMVNLRCRDGGPAFPDHFVRPIEGSAADRPCMELAKLAPTFFVPESVVFARYSDFRYLVVWV